VCIECGRALTVDLGYSLTPPHFAQLSSEDAKKRNSAAATVAQGP
jgi:hypothetical protein